MSAKIRRTVVVLVAVVLSPAVVGAAPAANDDIAGAIKLDEGVEARFSTVDATSEPGEDRCGGDNTVWFTFGTQTAGRFVAYATGSDHDTDVGWSNSLPDLTGACNDDAFDSSDAVEEVRVLNAFEQEFIPISAHTTGDVGTGGVGVVALEPAADDFDAAGTLARRADAVTAVAGIEFSGGEGTETGESVSCGGTSLATASAWLDFVAPESGTWMFESKSISATDLAVYQGDQVDALTLLDCASTDRAAVVVHITEGATYRIRVAGTAISEPVVVRAEFAPVPMTATLIDDDGDGSSTDVGEVSDLALVDGRPAVAYHDADNRELRYASRATNGTWTDTLIDANGDGTSTNVGTTLSLAILPNGQPAVAYHDADNRELRYASRATNGTWTDTLIDANGDGTSTNVGRDPGLVVFASGDLGVSYLDDDAAALRFATRAGGSWSDELVVARPGATLAASPAVLDVDDEPVVAMTDVEQGNHLLAWRRDGAWTFERDHADRHIGERDRGCARPELLLDDATVFVVWADCNQAGTLALSLRKPDGEWTAEDVVPSFQPVESKSFNGSDAVWGTTGFGTTWLPDGRMAVSVHSASDDALWYAEDALVAEAGPDVGSLSSTTAEFDATASVDRWGDIAFFTWSDVPAGCTLVDDDTLTPSISCNAPTSETITLTVIDTDDFSHSDTAGFMVAATEIPRECDDAPDPFTDVAATSFARLAVTCIFNLGVTTGTSPTTYAPNDLVTREQMASFLARLYESMNGAPAPAVSTPFTDVAPTSFARLDIARIFGLGITTGTSPTSYSPDGLVTREQMAAFLARLYRAVEGIDAPAVSTPFTDVAPTSFARLDIARIFGLGVTTGTSPTTYSPDGLVTREQMAAFLARLYLSD